jgi:uncharacterized protein (DUF2236 family)
VERDIRDYIDGQGPFYAGTANVIMQLGRPEVGYGVYESTVDSGNVMLVPRKRARTTVAYLAVALLGTDEERRLYRRAVNGQHAQVRSTDRSPVSYNAFDRELQLWVAACLARGARDLVETLHGPLSPDEAEWLHRQSARLGTTLQVREEQWPATVAEFEDYWRAGLKQVSYDDTLRGYLDDLLDLRQLPEAQRRPLAGFHRWVNTGFLPPEFRDALGLRWTEADQDRFDRKMARVGARNRRVPRSVRMFPFNYVLWNFRARVRLGLPLV